MKRNFILILSIICSFIFSSEIKEKTLETINDYYKKDIKINDFKFSIPKKIKSKIQNQVNQKFYRDQIYYWTIEFENKTHYALMDNTIGKTM